MDHTLAKGCPMRHTLIVAAIVVAACLLVGIVADFYIEEIKSFAHGAR